VSPSEALSIAVTVSVTLAGFAGIVAAFGRGAIQEWPQADRMRLKFLLSTSLLPTGWCLVGLLLLTTALPQPLIWKICSGVSVLSLLVVGPNAVRDFLVQSRSQPRDAQLSRVFFFSSCGLWAAAGFLQAGNMVELGAFWPFYAMVVGGMLICIVQFARLVLGPR
jgi:hypothetical protein